MSSAHLSHHDKKAVMSLAGSIVTLYPSFLLIHISTVETFSHFTKKLLLWKTKNITSLLWFVSVCGHVGSFFYVNCNYVNLGSCWWVTLKRCNKRCFSEQMSDVIQKVFRAMTKHCWYKTIWICSTLTSGRGWLLRLHCFFLQVQSLIQAEDISTARCALS